MENNKGRNIPALLQHIFFRQKIDYSCFYVMIILITIGIIMILSTSSNVGFTNFSDSYFFIKKHTFFLLLGIIFFIAGVAIPHEHYKKIALPGIIFSIVLLTLTLIPGIGIKAGGARRWLNLGLVRIQPVEIAKFFIILFLSTSIVNKGKSISNFKNGLLPILVLLFIPLLLILQQPDFGNSVLIMSVSWILLFTGKANIYHMFSLSSAALISITISIMLNPYQLDRIIGFLSPWEDPLGKNYHIIQSFIAVGSGGIFGLGLGQSKLKFFYLPLQYSDFIFSIICEEGGFILALFVISLYGYLLYKGTKIACQSESEFSFYLGFGLTLLLVLQAVVNIGVVIGFFPITGIPLPFISFGGTSLITSIYYIGVLLNISKKTKKLRADAKQ